MKWSAMWATRCCSWSIDGACNEGPDRCAPQPTVHALTGNDEDTEPRSGRLLRLMAARKRREAEPLPMAKGVACLPRRQSTTLISLYAYETVARRRDSEARTDCGKTPPSPTQCRHQRRPEPRARCRPSRAPARSRWDARFRRGAAAALASWSAVVPARGQAVGPAAPAVVATGRCCRGGLRPAQPIARSWPWWFMARRVAAGSGRGRSSARALAGRCP